MNPSDSFVRNCVITGREGEVLFTRLPSGQLVVNLDGYAIVPLEQLQEFASARRVDTDEVAR